MTVILVRKKFIGNATFDKLKLWVIPVGIKGEKRKLDFNLLRDAGNRTSHHLLLLLLNYRIT